MTDFRALCAELVQAFEDLRDSSHGVFGLHLNGDLAPWDELIEGGRFKDWLEVFARARAALAKPADAPAAVAERPSDEELRDLWSWAAGQDQGPWPTQYHCFARAVLARWGNPAPAPPADGEVAELVAWLEEEADDYACIGNTDAASKCNRAADLLQHLSPPQPVPVSERLPVPGDCDAEGRCWLRGKVEGDWRLLDPNNSGVPQLKYCFSHWLPAYALPLPGQEVEG